LNIWQVLADAALSTAPEAVRNVAHKRIPSLEECSAPLRVHVARNSVAYGNADISHITWEFEAIQGMFFSCATFDGTGPYGVGANKFAMPGQKINMAQKALVLLTLMEFAMTDWADGTGTPHVEGNFEKLKAKIQQDYDGGVSDLSLNYDQMCRVSRNIIAGHLNGGKVISRAS
jgi:hypothetical protein